MDKIKSELQKSIQTGFIDRSIESNNEYIPRILTNNKAHSTKVLSTIISELNSCTEFFFSVAFVTNGGVQSLVNTLIELKERNINGSILVSQYLNFTQPEALRKLLCFPNIKLRINNKDNFHAKGYLFKKSNYYSLIIGSSNLTADALSSNKELNIKISATPESYIIEKAIHEFSSDFKDGIIVDDSFINNYIDIYNSTQIRIINGSKTVEEKIITPNLMQVEALNNLALIRKKGKSKALLISATGTGKTYLSAFDAKSTNPKRLLFVVHRANIAKAAMSTFKKVYGNSKSMGFFSGAERNTNSDLIFSTIQTLSKEEHLNSFQKDQFDYIIIDESHRAAANTYKKILNHFKAKFVLGMTATPERMDGLDIFSLYDHNIAYEIRLQRALEENMLCPFHYFGVTDITVNGNPINELSNFRQLTSQERVDRILEKIKLYNCDDGNIRGLIFCSSVAESNALSQLFNQNGLKTISLSGDNSEYERSEAIDRLESDDPVKKIDYIITVDIFNEGIDIPSVNQIIMLRPTQSAIIFVQQLGRGLRKSPGKEYLTVIDFIGNYANNFLIPIALYGDTTYNKDHLRKLLASGSSSIPGTSTINFDKISKDRIFAAIDSAKFTLKKDLVSDYRSMKAKLGRIPMMLDFVDSRDPQNFIEYSGSYFNFVATQEADLNGTLDKKEIKLLELFSNEINNSVRVEESVVLLNLIINGSFSTKNLFSHIKEEYGYDIPNEIFNSCYLNLNFLFITEQFKTGNGESKLIPAGIIHSLKICELENDIFKISHDLKESLKNDVFRNFLLDSTNYSINTFKRKFKLDRFNKGFIYYQKYSRKDVFRVLFWTQNQLAQNVGGYIFNPERNYCPIFVNYHKSENISATTKYDDVFINNLEFGWMSKSNRKISSPEIISFKNYESLGLRLPLFVKKSNDEGNDFYYMGDMKPIKESFELDTLVNDKNKSVPVVRVKFNLNEPVEDSIYDYITKS